MFRSNPWFICGDFNEILDRKEHSNSQDNLALSTGMSDFQDIVRHCSLTDLAFHGPRYTWTNIRAEGLICKKLDRGLVNSLWLQKFPQSYCTFNSGGCSDHARGKLCMGTADQRGKRPFKFSNVLANLPQFSKSVGEYWIKSQPLFVSTSALFRLSKKLKALKLILRKMGRENLIDISRRAKEAHANLCSKQEAILQTPQLAMLMMRSRLSTSGASYQIWKRVISSKNQSSTG